ncbi:uncharacterized protein B0P05DRAFT_345814 [Gilbertella persicaria]|uniref:uncharacterized protein n=1 Tax=Gilbertella persicaria TaxID=101096 RepID=UPI00221F369A|nr:uncharacterized protein B0P05DRAFT_345814 [Gilbertella persicaria]KAI8047810.1 hypothetical protein B0P05DRAFT_345814 [Gilbertella persicaria]
MYSMEEPTQFQMLIRQVDDDSLQTMLQQEYQQLIIEQQHLVTMLSQRARMFETENTELREIIHESQRRYEKAVREMQFFKKKHDRLVESYYQDERTSQWTEEGQRTRQSSTTSGSIYSSLSSSTNESHEKKSTFSRHSIYSTPGSGASSVITPVRSSMSSSTYAGSSMIQQRRIDPLTFGGSDALWDTISKSEGADVTVEKIIRYI